MKNNRFVFKSILYCSYFFKILPGFLISFIWSVSCPFEGAVSIFIRNIILFSKLKNFNGVIYVGRNVTIKNIDGISVGKNISIHANCYLDGAGGIDIGDNVSIAHNSSILSFEHTAKLLDLPIKYNPVIYKYTYICSDVWVGCGVRIIGGSYIHSRVIIAAGSVVRGILDEKSLYAGVPAKRVKSI